MYPPPPWTARPPQPPPPPRRSTGGLEIAVWLLTVVVTLGVAPLWLVLEHRTWDLVIFLFGGAWVWLLTEAILLGIAANRSRHPARAWTAFIFGMIVLIAAASVVALNLLARWWFCELHGTCR